MKKIINVVSMLAAVLLAGVSCSQEIGVEVTPSVDKAAKVHMSFSAGLDTKAYIVDDAAIAVNWNDTDKIAVWDGTEWCEFSATSVTGNTAVFEGEITPKGGFEVTDFKAVYPYSAVTDKSAEAISISVPVAQVIPEGKAVDTSALVAVATSNAEGLLSFSQVCALVKVHLKYPKNSVVLNGTGFAGTVVCNDDGSIASSTARTDAVTVTSATGVLPGAANYYVAVLPTTAVLTVDFVSDDSGYTGSRSTDSAFAFEQGVAKAFIQEAAITGVYNISTPAQLVACANNWSEGFTDTVNLNADLDMDGVALTGTRNFAGVFNGNNHKIYNLVLEGDEDVCFIRNLVGELNDLILGSSDGVNYDGKSSIVLYNTSGDGNWHYAAPIIRLKTLANIENVTNFIPVSVKAGSNVKTRISGFVGTIHSGPFTISNCTNYGAVSNNATASSTTDSYMSGILGPMDAAGTLTNVTNRGNLVCANPYVAKIGGVCSAVYGGSNFTNCDNYGNISFGNLTLQSTTYVGGIAANGSYNYTKKTTMSGCDNHGTITGGATTAKALYIGGVCGFMRNVELNNCDNSGAVSTNHINNARLGGIVGSIHASGIVTGCDNSGDVTLTQGSANTAWQGVGGVAGFSENTPVASITNCSNSGTVSATMNTTGAKYFRVSVGGIIGMAYTGATVSNNVNRGDVIAENSHASTPYCQLGGIMGSDSDNSGACTVSGNVNYGTVTLNNGNDSYAYTGGLFGKLNYTTSVTACKMFGNVAGTNAGAVAGFNADADIEVTICSAVKVNGETKDAAADEDDWLCPNDYGVIDPSYVAHDAEE